MCELLIHSYLISGIVVELTDLVNPQKNNLYIWIQQIKQNVNHKQEILLMVNFKYVHSYDWFWVSIETLQTISNIVQPKIDWCDSIVVLVLWHMKNGSIILTSEWHTDVRIIDPFVFDIWIHSYLTYRCANYWDCSMYETSWKSIISKLNKCIAYFNKLNKCTF